MPTVDWNVILVTGGARSGKSRYAQELAEQFERRAYVATAQARDDVEMAERIARHRRERGARFETLEEPLDVAASLVALNGRSDVAIVDCATLWLANLFERDDALALESREVGDLLTWLRAPRFPVVVVTNEVGLGIVPENPLARRFRDAQGQLNQRLAAVSDVVVLTACGLPLLLKGEALPR